MICKHFIHIGLGDTGEGLIRNAIARNLGKMPELKMIDGRAHLLLVHAKQVWEKECPGKPLPPVITWVRNPFDWRISFWIHQLMNRRYAGTFYDFCTKHDAGYIRPEFSTGPGVRMIDYWNMHGLGEADFVGKFETIKEDMCQILPKLLKPVGVTRKLVESWFPSCYTYWRGRQWIECIEQWMREELYPPDLIERVYEEDAYLFDRFGYTFEEHYEFD